MPQKRCWNCGAFVSSDDRLCPDCGADSWNRPQGVYGSPTPQSNIQQVLAHSDESSRKAAAGIVMVATIVVFSFWYSVVIQVISMFRDDPFYGVLGVGTGLTLFAALVAAGLAAASWAITKGIVE